MSLIRRHPLWFIGGAGLAIRLVLAFAFYGSGDLLWFEIVGNRANAHPLHAYDVSGGGLPWNYGPGYLPWLVGALKLAHLSGLPFHDVVQLAPIAADLGLAVAVYAYLGWREASEGSRVAGFSLVMFGPVFIAISGYHGQLDSVAILPGVLALMVWERRSTSTHAVESGLLVGVGAALKTVPMLLVLPLLASARSLKEGARLLTAAAAVVVLTGLPFYLATPSGFTHALRYSGIPSRGGLSLVADPGFAADRRTSVTLGLLGQPNSVATWLSHHSGLITLFFLVALAAFLFRYRPAPIDGIVLLWLAVFAFSPNFLLQYLIWALPFFIMAGYLLEVAVLQAAMVPPLVITYLEPQATPRAAAVAYVVIMIGLWAFWVAALIALGRRTMRNRDRHPDGTQPPMVELKGALSRV